LALYKNFKITERQSVQFRISANNFLNHPLPQFGLAGTADESLNFTRNYTIQLPEVVSSGTSDCTTLGLPADTANPSVCNYKATAISPTNTNANTTGKPKFKTGQRTLLFALKYYF
jgi:hypothetical protein